MAAIVIAHRTCPRDTAENSLDGIRRAAQAGADVVELDVRITRDCVPVLIHDRTLRRTTGVWRPVSACSLAALRTLRLDNGEGVPTLAEALAALPDGLRVAIDVKTPRAIDPVLDEVRNQNRRRDVMLWSQHLATVRIVAQREPEIEGALLRDTFNAKGHDALFADARRCGARAISARWEAITPQFATGARETGLVLYSWYRALPEPSPKLTLLDGIVSDWPAEVRTALTRGCLES